MQWSIVECVFSTRELSRRWISRGDSIMRISASAAPDWTEPIRRRTAATKCKLIASIYQPKIANPVTDEFLR